MSKNPRIQALNETLMIVQLDKYIDKFETEMAKENKKTTKWLKIGFIPFGISVGLSLVTINPVPLIVGTAYLGTITIVKMIKDDQEVEEKIKRKYNPNPKVTQLSSETPDFDFLNEPIMTKTEEDYHSDYFKQKLAEAARITKLTLVDEKGNVISSNKNNQEAYVEEPGFLNKEETMIQVSTEYKTYKIAYNLPELSITNKEWDILFDTVYHKLEEKDQVESFYNYMSFLQRYVIAYSLIHNKKEISFQSYIDQVHRLEHIGLTKEEIKDIITKLNQNKKSARILKLDFSSKKRNK